MKQENKGAAIVAYLGGLVPALVPQLFSSRIPLYGHFVAVH